MSKMIINLTYKLCEEIKAKLTRKEAFRLIDYEANKAKQLW